MAILPVLIAPDPRLRVRAAAVEVVDDYVLQLVENMLETMYAAHGIGLAATQLGVPQRVVVLDLGERYNMIAPLLLINPEIAWASPEERWSEEGCLSVPDIYEEVKRADCVRVRYIDQAGERHEISASGMLATCLQHEIDHLDGHVFIDYLSALKRNMILRKLQKIRKLAATE